MGEPYVGRLAPSPTGRLHLGHARSFLIAWWRARSVGGRIVLRVEDLDAARVRPGAVEECIADLAWLGLDWDGDVLLQSADLAPYEEAVTRLLDERRAYACVCSRREILAALSAPHAGDAEARYPGTCRHRFTSVEVAEGESGRSAGVRLVVKPGAVAVTDAVHGARSFDVAAEVGDILLARRDGVFAYQLAVVVDDARQAVTEVVRGADLLPSAARQQLVYAALGLAPPAWVHAPLVVHQGGERLAKRRADLALAALRTERVDPRAVVAWAARTCGLETGARATAAEVVAHFALETLPRDTAVLDAPALAAIRR